MTALDGAIGDLRVIATLIERPPLDGVQLRRDVAIRAARAITIVLSALYGMVAWQGGDRAPADWDGGPVLHPTFGIRHIGVHHALWRKPLLYTPVVNTAPEPSGIDWLSARFAKVDGLDWDEVCAIEAGREDCDSSTCIAAGDEDHDPAACRDHYRRYARIALMTGGVS